jgi:hypothetical protein
MQGARVVDGSLLLASGVSFAAVYFVGGPFLFLLVLLGLCFAGVLLRRGVSGPLALLLGQIFGLSYVYLAGALVVPVLRAVPLLQDQLFVRSPLLQPEYARTYVYTEIFEMRQLTVITLIFIPSLIVLVLNHRAFRYDQADIQHNRKGTSGRESRREALLTWLIASFPLFVAALKKAKNPYEYVAATMSGDGRNFFTVVENIRVTARPTQLSQILGQGDFMPNLASFASSALGARGRLDFRDQYAIAAIYAYLSAIIVASLTACAFSLLSRYRRGKDSDLNDGGQLFILWCLAPLLCIVGFFVSNFGPVVNEVFRSGFFSLYGAYALIASFLALNVVDNSRVAFVAKVAVIGLLSITYSLAVGLLLACFLPGLFTKIKRRRLTLPVVVAATVGTSIVIKVQPWQQLLETLRGRVALNGAIIPLSPNLPRNVLVASGVLYLILGTRHVLSRVFRDVALVALAGLVLRSLITKQRERIGLEGYGYYGAKNDYMIYFAAIFLVASALVFALGVVLIHVYRDASNSKWIHRTAHFGLGLVWAYSAVAIGNLLPASNTFLSRSTTWIQPRATSVEFATSTWKKGDVIYLSEDDPGEARILNFWIPYFWKDPGWNWVYFEFTTDPVSVCAVLEKDDAELVTSSVAVENGIRDRCGNLLE